MNSQNNPEIQEQPKKKPLDFLYNRKWKKAVIIAFAILLCLALIVAGTFGFMWISGRNALLDQGNQSMTAPSEIEVDIDDDGVVRYNGKCYAFNENMTSVMIIGVDDEERTSKANGQADALYLMAVDTKTGKITVIAISRDIMADVNVISDAGNSVGIKQQQICNAYAYGTDAVSGCENTVDSVSRLLYGVPINTYFSMKWTAISVLTDYVGGVTVPAYDSNWNPTGKMTTVYGKSALNYIQKRSKTNLEGNNNRMKRQIDYLKGFAAKSIEKTKQDITTPVKLYNRLNRYSCNNLDVNRITYLATVFINGGAELEFVSVPGELVQGEQYAEMYVDQAALYEIILDVFYNEI